MKKNQLVLNSHQFHLRQLFEAKVKEIPDVKIPDDFKKGKGRRRGRRRKEREREREKGW